jgi:effector-binding domain-containing protein
VGSGLEPALAVHGIKPNGSAFAHHLQMTPERFDFELGFLVSTPVKAAGRVKLGALRAAKVARTVYHGGYEDLPDAWGEFMGWIEANGHTPATDLWEWYVVGPHLSPNPADWRTELNRPVLD